MGQTSEPMELTTLRAPKDIARMVSVLSALDHKTIAAFFDEDMRDWITKRYRTRMAKEGRTADLGGEG